MTAPFTLNPIPKTEKSIPVSAPPEFAQFAIVIDDLGMVIRSLETEMSLLPLELNALLRNVQMLLELESCLPRERLLPADELRALSDAAKSMALDETPQRRIGHTEFGRDVVDRQVSPQQAPHFRDAISELGVELRTRLAVRHEPRLHDVAAERGDCGWPPHAGTCDLPPRSPAKPCDSAGARSSLVGPTEPTEIEMLEKWTKDSDGNIKVSPLVGYEIAPAMETAIVVRLELLNETDQVENPTGSAQIVVTPHQAIELAQVLLRKAEQILAMKPEGRPS